MTLQAIAKFQLAVVGAILALCACSSGPLPRGEGAYVVETGHEYKLGPGDKLRITVFGEENLSGEFTVSYNGGVAMPLVGEVRAGGHTPEGSPREMAVWVTAATWVGPGDTIRVAERTF